MILDTLENLENYSLLHPLFGEVVSFVRNTYLMKLENGKHPIGESGLFASVSEYDTRTVEESFVESHRKYIDIQILATGTELIGYCPVVDCQPQPFDEEKDMQKMDGPVSFFVMRPDRFAVFFPQDGHMPNIRVDASVPVKVKKVVFKVPVLPA